MLIMEIMSEKSIIKKTIITNKYRNIFVSFAFLVLFVVIFYVSFLCLFAAEKSRQSPPETQ